MTYCVQFVSVNITISVNKNIVNPLVYVYDTVKICQYRSIYKDSSEIYQRDTVNVNIHIHSYGKSSNFISSPLITTNCVFFFLLISIYPDILYKTIIVYLNTKICIVIIIINNCYLFVQTTRNISIAQYIINRIISHQCVIQYSVQV